MHVEGFNIHALVGAIYIALSISFVVVAVICIDKTNIFLRGPAINMYWANNTLVHLSLIHI